jgi:hypothetical protein
VAEPSGAPGCMGVGARYELYSIAEAQTFELKQQNNVNVTDRIGKKAHQAYETRSEQIAR